MTQTITSRARVEKKLRELRDVMDALADASGNVMSNGAGEEEFEEAAWNAVNWWTDNDVTFSMSIRKALQEGGSGEADSSGQ